MNVNSVSGFTSQMRLTGLSGFDTETIVQELMNAARIPLDQLQQKRTLVEWKQAAYREISSSLIGFKSKYFDIINRSTYLLSENSIRPLTAASSNEDYVSATAAGATAGTNTIRVEQLATADKAVSFGTITGKVTDKNLDGKKISVTVDGVTKNIALKDYTDVDDKNNFKVADLQQTLDDAFGASKIDVAFDAANQTLSIDVQNAGKVTVGNPSDGSESGLSGLGLTEGVSTSTGGISKVITGTVTDKNLLGNSISVTLDGVTKEIALEDYTDDDLEEKLQAALDKAFGASKIDVAFNAADQTLSIAAQNGATKVTVTNPSDETKSGLSGLGLSSGESNRISLNSTLSELRGRLEDSGKSFDFDKEGNITFAVNGAIIIANENDTFEEVFDKINKSEGANVTASYDEITDRVSIVSKQTGAGDNLKIPGEIDPETLKNYLESPDESDLESLKSEIESDTRDFFAAMGIYQVTDEGQDAKVLINGTQELVRSANDFTVNGITYHLHKAHEADFEGETITVEQETETVINSVKSFVEEYNKLIDTINEKISESYDRDYQPLTDAQKDDMDEKDIEKWEEKAKTGILRNDSLLEEITFSMRKAIYEPVEGVNLTMSDIGISSESYTDYGKLYLDENKLKDVLLNKPDEATKLLNGTSKEVPYYSRDLTAEEKEERYNSSGVFQRLSDIVEDNISTKRDADGNKGALLVKAGIEDDLSNTENLLSDELGHYDDRIDEMIDRLIVQEENYYTKFSNLEVMLNQMNQQSTWIMSQFGGGQ